MKQAYKHSILSLAIATALTLPSVATAAENTEDSSIDSIIVLGETYRNTATKTSLEIEETPQVVNTIDSEQLEIRAVHSLGEILQYTPGVTTDFYGADANFQNYYTIRGFDAVNTYYNGTALQTLTGWSLQPQIDPIVIEQVEIFKGPTSALYGGTAPGGMVNIISKTPQKESTTTVGAALGTDNLQELSIDSAGQIGDSDFDYRFIGLATQSDTQTGISGNERYVFAPSINWNISEKTLLSANLYYQNDPEAGNNTAIPEAALLANNTEFSLGDKNWIDYEREFLMAGYKFQHEFNNQWTFLQSFNYITGEFSQQNVTAYGYDDTTGDYSVSIYSTDETSQSFTFDNQLSAKLVTGEVEHNFLIGADIQKLDGTSRYDTYGVGSGNIYTSNNSYIDTSSLVKSNVSDDDIHTTQTGVYIQDQIKLDKLVVIASLRYDQYDADGSNYGASYKNDASNLSYRLGGLYTFDNGLAPFASYSTSFQPTTTTDSEPELGAQIEFGLKYQSESKAVSGSATLFNLKKTNVTYQKLNTDSSGTIYYTPEQAGEVTSQGLELESKLQVTDALDIIASYTYSDVEITEGVPGNSAYTKGTTPIFSPEHTANLWANYSFYSGILNGSRIGTGIRYVGEMQKDSTNTQGMVSDYTVVDLSLDYDLSYASSSLDGASVSLLISNLFDKQSYTCYSEDYCWNNAGLAAELNINYTF